MHLDDENVFGSNASSRYNYSEDWKVQRPSANSFETHRGKGFTEHRARGTEDEILDRLFIAFETKSPYYRVSDLANDLDQPELFIKQLLSKVAYQVTREPYKNYYAIREEYRSLALKEKMKKLEDASKRATQLKQEREMQNELNNNNNNNNNHFSGQQHNKKSDEGDHSNESVLHEGGREFVRYHPKTEDEDDVEVEVGSDDDGD